MNFIDLEFCFVNWKLFIGDKNFLSNVVFGGLYGYGVN